MLLVSLIASAAAAPCRIAELCAPLLPGRVRPDECSVERLKVGNTNVLHRLDTVAGDRYLVRQFGKQAALAFDRDRENAIFLALADAELAPACIATWPDGRIEGWIDGQPCTADECRQPAVSERVAEGLAALHAKGPSYGAAGGQCWAWDTIEVWLDGARRCADALESSESASKDLLARVQSIDLMGVATELSSLRKKLDAADLPCCFCHNDLSNTNCHRDPSSGSVRLIDFEFGGWNYRGFDLATHLTHWAGGAIDGLYDDSAFPSKEERRPFLEAYAARMHSPKNAVADSCNSMDTAATVARLEAEISATLPLAHAVWGLWALCALPAAVANGAADTAPFSHVEYAERRLAAFFKSLTSDSPPS